MSKRKSIKSASVAAPLPSTGGSFIQGDDGQLVPNPDDVVTRPHPGKTVLAAEEAAKRKRGNTAPTEALTPSEPGDVSTTATGEE